MRQSTRDLMNIAYESAKDNFGNTSFNFAALWAKTWSVAKEFRKDSIENWIGAFYTELLIDPRFVYVGNQQWRLREFMDYNEYLKEIGKRAQDVQLKEPESAEGETKEKVEVKKRGRGRKSALPEPTDTIATVVEAQEKDTQPIETEEVNLDEDMVIPASTRPQESEDDEDNYE